MSKPVYLMAKAAMIKPIMHADDEGKLALIGRTFGRKQSVKSLIEKTFETIEEPEKATIFIAHGDALEEAQRIKNELENRLHPKEIRVDYLSATIGAHSGPGTLAIFYFAKHRI